MKASLFAAMTALILTSLVPAGVHAKVVDKIVAIVNEEIITLSDLEKYKKNLQTGGLTDEALMKMSDPQLLLKDKNALMNQVIDEKVMDSEVKRKGMEVTIERVEQEIRTIAQNNNITRNQLKDALAAKGVAMSRYQDFIKTSLERQALIEREVTSKIRISDDDISAYYLAKMGPSAAQTFEYTLSHIMFSSKTGGDQAALNRARAVEEKLKSGQSFEKLAEQYSEDPDFTKGGSFGVFKAGEMSKALESAVRKVGTGEVTGIVKTGQGYDIIKINKRTLVSDPRFD
jgi:peptidyl-prolyl cis-trans isomerase SurA